MNLPERALASRINDERREGWKCFGHTFRRFTRILVRELDFQLEEPAFPDGLVFARDGAVPLLQVEGAGVGAGGFGHEAEGVGFAPLFARDDMRC